MTEFDQVEVHLTILQNIELVNIFRIFVNFLFDKPSDESRSTNGDAKALTALYCENLVVILGFQERTQRLAEHRSETDEEDDVYGFRVIWFRRISSRPFPGISVRESGGNKGTRMKSALPRPPGLAQKATCEDGGRICSAGCRHAR